MLDAILAVRTQLAARYEEMGFSMPISLEFILDYLSDWLAEQWHKENKEGK